MKKIAIIGANSYIARNMCTVIEKKYDKYDIYLYDRAEKQVDGRENYKSIDVLDKKSLENIDFDCDYIYLFVGKTGTANGFDVYDEFINVNEIALLNILSIHREKKSKAKIIFPSTRLVYKGVEGLLNENSEKEFNTVYAVNKFACEMYLEQYRKVFDINYCIFRICVPYGTLIENASSYGTAEFMIKSAKEKGMISLYGDGEVRRTLTHMEDLCNILVKYGVSDACINDVFNVGGEDYSLKEMANMIANKYSASIDFVPYPELARKIESGSTVFDDGKLQSIDAYAFKHQFEDWCKKS